MTAHAESVKENADRVGVIKTRNLRASKDTTTPTMKRQGTGREEIFASHVSDEELVFI